LVYIRAHGFAQVGVMMSGECDKCGDHALDCKCSEDDFIRHYISSSMSYFDPNGDMPLILDLNGRPLTRDEILELVKNDRRKKL